MQIPHREGITQMAFLIFCHFTQQGNDRSLDFVYYAWIDRDRVGAYKPTIDELLAKYNITSAQVKKLNSIWSLLKAKNLTDLGLKRKKRIIDRLFYKRDIILATMEFYCAVLPMFQSFVLYFTMK